MKKPFLQSYGGETIQQLINMEDGYRIDSLVLAIEQALDAKPEAELSEPERVVLAVEAMEREVNNNGYDGFFFNSSRIYTSFLVRALELIGCPKVATISADAIAVLKLKEQFDPDTVHEVVAELSADGKSKLRECDSRYYANDENIEQNLFAYIKRHQNEIRIP